MYSLNMHRIYRSPEGADSVGDPAAAAGGEGSQGGAGEGAAASAAAAPQYVSKADFDSAISRFEQSIQRLTPRQQEAARDNRDNGSPQAPKEPDPKDFDFSKPGELARYNRAAYKYNAHLDEQENAPKRAQAEAENKWKESERGHVTRLSEYRKENPAAAAEMDAAKIPQVLEEVKRAVFSSRNSHLALHYLAKNPESASELNLLAETQGVEAVREMVGEMVASMKAEAKALEANVTAAGQRPPRQNLRGGANAGPRKASNEELFNRFHSS